MDDRIVSQNPWSRRNFYVDKSCKETKIAAATGEAVISDIRDRRWIPSSLRRCNNSQGQVAAISQIISRHDQPVNLNPAGFSPDSRAEPRKSYEGGGQQALSLSALSRVTRYVSLCPPPAADRCRIRVTNIYFEDRVRRRIR